MRIEWSVLALEDREWIFAYIEQHNPRAAVAIDERISAQIERLARHPESGRLGRVEGTRELLVARTSYIVAYRVTEVAVRVLRILHGSQQWPDEVPA